MEIGRFFMVLIGSISQRLAGWVSVDDACGSGKQDGHDLESVAGNSQDAHQAVAEPALCIYASQAMAQAEVWQSELLQHGSRQY